MKSHLEEMVQRGHNFAIVDEVDSILIDEARTPLIISGPGEDQLRALHHDRQADSRARRRRLRTRREAAHVTLTEEGNEHHGAACWARPSCCKGDYALRPREHHHRPPRQPGAARPQAVPAGQGLHRQGRPGHHHRRVHRPHDGGPALFRRAAPGARGQGARRPSSPRTRPWPPSPSRTISGSTRSWPA